jgi:glycosyltransferase involved in cell wall biosynthesis
VIPVLFLAWYFPPVGGAGVQRSLAFVRHLPAHGFQPVVLAGPYASSNRWSPRDESLAAQLPSGVRVVWADTDPPPPRPLQRLRQRVTGLHAALAAHWFRHALGLGAIVASQEKPRAICVTLGPYECLNAALALGQVLQLPVVADLRDPWAFDEMNEYAHSLQRWCEHRRMRTGLSRCAAIVMNTPVASDLVQRHRPRLAERVHCITNGYEAADFAGPPPASSDRFRIVHTGYLHTDGALRQQRRPAWRRLLGAGQRGVDLWGRTHRYLLQALEELGRRSPALLARTELHLYGVSSAEDRALSAHSPVGHLVHDHGYCSHADTVAAMRSADLLFLPMQGLPAGRKASIVPGKTYEYLASGRPILAAVPEGDARDFVLAAGGSAVDPGDVAGLTGQLEQHVARGRVPDRPLGPEVTQFQRTALTARLAEVLRSVCARP